MRATDVYHNTPCRAPGLFLVSKTDPVGAVERSKRAYSMWVDMGIRVRVFIISFLLLKYVERLTARPMNVGDCRLVTFATPEMLIIFCRCELKNKFVKEYR